MSWSNTSRRGFCSLIPGETISLQDMITQSRGHPVQGSWKTDRPTAEPPEMGTTGHKGYDSFTLPELNCSIFLCVLSNWEYMLKM